jgi:TPR repeat protein
MQEVIGSTPIFSTEKSRFLSGFFCCVQGLASNLYICGMRCFLVFVVACSLAASLSAQATALQVRAWQGDSVAMMNLSEAYDFGRGVVQNKDSSDLYVRKAAAKGHPDGIYLLSAKETSQLFDAKRFAAGMALLEKAAQQDHLPSLAKLGEIHRTKNSGTAADKYYNLAKSYAYSVRAAQQGEIKSLRFCAESCLSGTGAPRNDSLGVMFMQRAAVEKGDVPAMVRLGDLFFEGRVHGRYEPFTALEWYLKALHSPRANVEQKALADFGIYRVDRLLRQVHNGTMAAYGLSPAGSYDYLIRKE